jgi:hypothetical protein
LEIMCKVVSAGIDLGIRSTHLAVDNGDLVRVEASAPLKEMVNKGNSGINGNDGGK